MEYKKSFSESLIDNRIVYLSGVIDANVANNIIAQLLYLDYLNHEDIYLYINSNGGSVIDGLAIIDTMEYINSNVNTVVVGTAASMGAVILACGNKRYGLKHARVMIHQMYGGIQGTMMDMDISYKNFLDIKQSLTSLLALKTHKKIKTIEKDCERDNWMSITEAINYGLIDEVLIKPKRS